MWPQRAEGVGAPGVGGSERVLGTDLGPPEEHQVCLIAGQCCRPIHSQILFTMYSLKPPQ